MIDLHANKPISDKAVELTVGAHSVHHFSDQPGDDDSQAKSTL
jgi:hypothetical protein